ncbi:MAG: hypothetical protein LBK67_02925 [Coriobacteriales bacterium]|nr:hypothetical protein [Coriobacteriales bacterium]
MLNTSIALSYSKGPLHFSLQGALFFSFFVDTFTSLFASVHSHHPTTVAVSGEVAASAGFRVMAFA